MREITHATAIEADRAVAQATSELASICGDLESEVRRLANRISVALPGGSPFDVIDKQQQQAGQPTAGAVPRPVQSVLTVELQMRVYQLQQLAQTVKNMAERIEL